MNLILVGTGNVAFVLSQLLLKAGHSIREVYGRDALALQQLSQLTGCKTNKNLSGINSKADICIITVSDDAIAAIARQIKQSDMMVVHTSGATSMEVLNRFDNYGVLYPLQSLRKELKKLPVIPFFIDANNQANREMLLQLATSTGNTATVAGDEKRLKTHLAAVLCSNFINHLYAVTQYYCISENIAFNDLLPLIRETAGRLSDAPAADLQTGPAIRNDSGTLQRHVMLLQAYPQIAGLYKILSDSIQNFLQQ